MAAPPDDLERELLDLMGGGAGAELSDAAFDSLARRVFAAQFEACAPLRAFCERRGRIPGAVRHWTEIPAVPTEAFKEVTLVSDPEPVARVFLTSGTTRAVAGKHHMTARALGLYRASMLPTFRRFLLPELEGLEAAGDGGAVGEGAAAGAGLPPRSALQPIVLGPASDEAPQSSLAFMIDGVCRSLCAAPARHFLGPHGLDEAGLARELGEAERDGRPVLLLGTSLAFLEVAERWTGRRPGFYLPRGSRAMETGGAKGRRREIAPSELRDRIAEAFGIGTAGVVNEYGMTEAASQFYDGTLLERWLAELAQGGECDLAAEPVGARRAKRGPPWARALVCDPETLDPAPPGATGVLRIVDLANRYTVSFLQTADLAVAVGDGPCGPGSGPFELVGRAPGAEARGCSLAAEEWARAMGGGGR
jgi:hypothetical protein